MTLLDPEPVIVGTTVRRLDAVSVAPALTYPIGSMKVMRSEGFADDRGGWCWRLFGYPLGVDGCLGLGDGAVDRVAVGRRLGGRLCF